VADEALTRTGTALGTCGYMAPEQRRDARCADARADVYGLGATLFALLAGADPVDPFAWDVDAELGPAVPEPLRALVRDATRFEPGERPVDMGAVVARLEAALAVLPPVADGVPALAPLVPPLAWDGLAPTRTAAVPRGPRRWPRIAAALAGLAGEETARGGRQGAGVLVEPGAQAEREVDPADERRIRGGGEARQLGPGHLHLRAEALQLEAHVGGEGPVERAGEIRGFGRAAGTGGGQRQQKRQEGRHAGSVRDVRDPGTASSGLLPAGYGRNRAPCRALLHSILNRMNFTGIAEGPDPASRAVRELLAAGGKRLRARLVLEAGALCGAAAADLEPLAAAAELVHAASLLHDDVLDGAVRRRGLPAAWCALGVEAAVLGGDLAHLLALDRVARARAPALARLLETTTAMVSAQSIELTRLRALEGGAGAWREIAWGKTAALCGWCAEVGAIAAGDPAAAPRLRAFGEGLGLAFQALDDLLDLRPGPAEGKEPLTDLRAGVPSLPLRLAAAADPALAAAIRAAWDEGVAPSPRLAAALLAAGGPGTLAVVEAEVAAAAQALDPLPGGAARAALDGALAAVATKARACLSA